MDFCFEAFCVLSLHLLSLHSAHSGILPSSMVNFRGQDSTFNCSGRGSIIWHIDDVPVSYKTIGTLKDQGIRLETLESGDDVESRLTVTSSTGRSNNNTLLRCVVIEGGTVVSFMASLTIIDMTPVHLALPDSNPSEFTLQWYQVYVPSGYTVLSYSVEVTDQSNRVLKKDSVTAAASQETYRYSYSSEPSRTALPECSRIGFLVSANTSSGKSGSVEVAWEKLKQKKELSDVFCSVVNTSFVRVEFSSPICAFQTADYTVALSHQDRQEGFVAGQIMGGRDTVNQLIKSTLAVESDKTFEALVTVLVRGESLTKKAMCFEKHATNNEAGLSRSSSSGWTGAQIAVFVISCMFLAAIVAGFVIILIIAVRWRR